MKVRLRQDAPGRRSCCPLPCAIAGVQSRQRGESARSGCGRLLAPSPQPHTPPQGGSCLSPVERLERVQPPARRLCGAGRARAGRRGRWQERGRDRQRAVARGRPPRQQSCCARAPAESGSSSPAALQAVARGCASERQGHGRFSTRQQVARQGGTWLDARLLAVAALQLRAAPASRVLRPVLVSTVDTDSSGRTEAGGIIAEVGGGRVGRGGFSAVVQMHEVQMEWGACERRGRGSTTTPTQTQQQTHFVHAHGRAVWWARQSTTENADCHSDSTCNAGNPRQHGTHLVHVREEGRGGGRAGGHQLKHARQAGCTGHTEDAKRGTRCRLHKRAPAVSAQAANRQPTVDAPLTLILTQTCQPARCTPCPFQPFPAPLVT